MAGYPASAGMPKDIERQVRRLHFADTALERAFREDYAYRSLPQLRLVFWVTLLIQIPLSINALVFDHWAVTDPRITGRLGMGVGLAAGGLLLARSPRFVRWSQAYMALSALLIGALLIILFVPLPADGRG